MSERDLPRGTAFLDELTRALGAGARGVVLAEGNWPSFVVAFGDQHLLLARDYPSSVQLSLPNGRHWSVATRRELDAALPAIAVAMHACRTQRPPKRATKKWLDERAAAEAAKKKEGDAMFGDVVEALRRGEQIRRGGGRWSVTYFFEKGVFKCTNFDEGLEDTSEISEDALRQAVQADPEDFRSVYGSRAGKKNKK